MKYILRDEAQVAAWSNQIGIDRVFGERGMENVIADWSASWCGAPKRGHTDHIILSFPKGTEAELAEAISREWAQEVFGGDYRDRYRYVAALHCNTDHVHAHVLVDKVGMEDGKFLSISRHSEISYDMMRELHAQIAGEHGLVLNASSRLSRGIMENAPRDTDLQAARKEGREPVVAPLDPESRALREAEIRTHAEGYRQLAQLAGMGLEADTPPDGWMGRIAVGAELAATNLMKGMPVKEGFAEGVEIPVAGADVIGRLIAARETLQAEADTAWSAIQDMAPGAEKVELEQLFAGQAREMGTLLGRDFLADHSSSVSPERDPYSVQGIAGLAARAGDEGNPLVAEADAALGHFRAELARVLAPMEARLEEAGSSVEEVAARFTAPHRSEAQLEASRPVDAQERADWLGLERDLQARARDVFAGLHMDRDLLADLARQDILDAGQGSRLADIATLDKLISDVRQDLRDGDMDQLAAGRIDPLMDRIEDPGLRQAVFSELKAIAAVDAGDDIAGRDSEPAATYRTRIETFERAEERGRDRDDTSGDYGL
ncbi:relaxase/mobilization nuclease domain-containing protein [Sulfitobacter sp. PR48]|uniref:relaxase/mobilization nuclease domain-containing protein n=1 Tax=Sulfitobacter sp. PR48 TaxID=3028383 RepID=UPI00237AFD70|nr:relaxase/mobilization nuclease domain-containing protein [Sulfitobacter sp. PR48]MDD9722351.1 relaxase/mobilization nuclease domain-containing protein [Sulfitobacter sp. PR48]